MLHRPIEYWYAVLLCELVPQLCLVACRGGRRRNVHDLQVIQQAKLPAQNG
jgi:hypothetical protein